jgi:hypothetical protein
LPPLQAHEELALVQQFTARAALLESRSVSRRLEVGRQARPFNGFASAIPFWVA